MPPGKVKYDTLPWMGTGAKKPRGERGQYIEVGIVFGDQQAGASASV